MLKREQIPRQSWIFTSQGDLANVSCLTSSKFTKKSSILSSAYSFASLTLKTLLPVICLLQRDSAV